MTFILAFSVGLGIGEHQRNFFRDSDWCYVYSPTGESIAVPLKSSPTMKRFADELLAVCKSKAKKGRDRTKPPAQFVFNVHRGLEPKAPLVFSVWYYPTDQLVDCYIEGTGSVALSLREEFQTEVKSFFARPASEIPSLIASLEFFPESFTHYRCLALEALGKQGKKSNEAVPVIQKLTKDKSPLVRIAAALALFRIEPTDDAPLRMIVDEIDKQENDEDQRYHAMEAFLVSGTKSKKLVSAAVTAMKNNVRTGASPFAKGSALGFLGQLGRSASDAVPEVMQALHDDSRHVRKDAAYTLSKISSPSEKIIAGLVKSLRDPDQDVQGAAIHSLGMFGKSAKVAIDPISTVAASKAGGTLRARAALALFRIDRDNRLVVPVLCKVLEEPDENGKVEAARVLRILGPKARAALPILMAQIGDSYFGRVAEETIKHITGK